MTSIALGKQSTNTGDVRRFSERRTSSASLKHLPRAFQLREDFLAQTAAEAFKNNEVYTAIEKETLTAVAPFLDLKKRSVAKIPETPHPSSPTQNCEYVHNRSNSHEESQPFDSSPPQDRSRGMSHSALTNEECGNSNKLAMSPGSVSAQQRGRAWSTDSYGTSPVAGKSSWSFLPNTPTGKIEMSRKPRSLSFLKLIDHLTDIVKRDLNYAYNVQSASAPVTDLIRNKLRAMSLDHLQPRIRNEPQVTAPSVELLDSAYALSRFVFESVKHCAPTLAELDEKFRLKTDVEEILQAIQPTASLIVLGSVANGLNLANADMDLMVFDDSHAELQLHDISVDLPSLLFERLRSRGYAAKLLSKTRIPLIKIQRDYVGGAFFLDISFDNPLAISNTALITTYSAIDERVPVLMMFVKLWARTRKISDSFSGTLKSYGFLLLLIYFLQNKCSPPVLPNLQMIPAVGRTIKNDEIECQGYDIWYFKEIQCLPDSGNSQSVGELLEAFFSHFAYEFDYRDWVASIRVPGGLQTKESKKWTQLVEHCSESGQPTAKKWTDRYILSIEDPFEISHNVARTVTRAGLYDIRGAFMAAVRAVRSNKLTELTAPICL